MTWISRYRFVYVSILSLWILLTDRQFQNSTANMSNLIFSYFNQPFAFKSYCPSTQRREHTVITRDPNPGRIF